LSSFVSRLCGDSMIIVRSLYQQCGMAVHKEIVSSAGSSVPESAFPRHRMTGVILMIEQLMMFILQDALFMLGYLARGSAFPKPLDRQEEERLIERAAQGDRQAREKLIEHNLRLCVHIARKYTVPGCDQDDLVSIGTVGLIKGVNTFKPGSGTQLSTYCARCIENPMLSCL